MGVEGKAQAYSGRMAAEISAALVRLFSDYTGRGPARARTYLQDDVVTVVLRETMTRSERRLVADGRGEHVLKTRRLVQEAMREEIVGAVQGVTGRGVLAFFSDNSLEPDIAVEVLLLDAARPAAAT